MLLYPNGRGNALKMRTVWVRIPPGAPYKYHNICGPVVYWFITGSLYLSESGSIPFRPTNKDHTLLEVSHESTVETEWQTRT